MVAGLLPRIDIKSEEKNYTKESSFSNTHRIAHAVIIALSTIILAPAFNKHFSDQWMGKLQALAWGGLSGGLYYLTPNSNTYGQWDKLDSHKGKKILINDSYKKRFLAYSLMAGLAVYGTWKQITTKPLFGNFAVAALLSGLTYTAMTPLNKKMLKWADPRLSEHKCKIFLKHLPITLLPILVAALFTRPLSRYFFSHKVSLSQLIGFIASSLFSIAATRCWIYNTENKDDANFLASIQLSSYDWGWYEGGLSIAAQVIVFVGSLIIFSAGKAVLKLAKENPSLYPMVPVGLSMAGSYLAGKTLGDLKSNDTGLVVGAITALVAGILVSPLLPSKSLSHRVSFKQSAGFTAVGLLPLLFAIKFIKEETADYELLR
ncbi:hypothetical protein NEPTK9_001764 [Candidatus Neptunochlamydia vexilliferae]|uniref:Uncharacterized protein n=1 Tax=Candidatus Neptunichlamydia vexilliferae TaxID=1651774 RepID=A0ABS0B3A8_9BACT|nr:hypothetical protein [Candidatus Neptunochlamydia vexilliferae]